MISNVLNKTDQNRTKTPGLLDISCRTLQNKIKEYGLKTFDRVIVFTPSPLAC